MTLFDETYDAPQPAACKPHTRERESQHKKEVEELEEKLAASEELRKSEVDDALDERDALARLRFLCQPAAQLRRRLRRSCRAGT